MPLAVCSTYQGRNQPVTMKTRPPITSAQKLPTDSSRALAAAVTGMAMFSPGVTIESASISSASATVGHAHAEKPDGTEHEHDDQHREDDRVVPGRADQLATEHLDQADEKPAHPRAYDVADTAEHRAGEGDDAEPEPQVPDHEVV